jgi:hypothetical protein
MSFSYGDDPANSVIDAVRLLTGDVVDAGHLLEDGSITWINEQWKHKGNIYFVASKAAELIVSRLAREVNFSADGQTVALGELQQKFTELAAGLWAQGEELLAGGSEIFAGGMLQFQWIDPTVAPLAFGTRMHDNPEAGQQDFGGGSDVPQFGSTAWGEQVP